MAAVAAHAAENAGYPYYGSIRSGTVFMREGPSAEHKVKWVYRHRGLPVEVIAGYDVWRQVRDKDGETGWMHISMLSRDRTAVIIGTSAAPVRRRAAADEPIIAYAESGAIGRLESCEAATCRLVFGNIDGWVDRARLWGIRSNEKF